MRTRQGRLSGTILAVALLLAAPWVALADGTVLYGWGRCDSGQLGGPEWTGLLPEAVPCPAGIAAAASGSVHTLVVGLDGSLWAWGDNRYGQLGDGTTTNRSNFIRILPSGVAATAAGGGHTLVLKTDGSLWACGANGSGQLGDGTTTDRTGLVRVLSSGVAAVAAGEAHTLILRTDGSLWACGENSDGQLGDGTRTDRPTPFCLLTSAVAAAAGGGGHTLVLKTDGSLWSCGLNRYGQLGDGTATGRLFLVPAVPDGVGAVAAGVDHSFLVRTDGSLWGFGYNATGQLGDGTTTHRLLPVPVLDSGVASVAAGWLSTLILKTDGSLWACGDNSQGSLGDGTTTGRLTPVPILAAGVTSVSTRRQHAVVTMADHSVRTWGTNSYGELGRPVGACRTPLQRSADDVLACAPGWDHLLILHADGSLWASGKNEFGQLGDGTRTSRPGPVRVFDSGVVAASGGGQHSVALKADGSLWAWGRNGNAQLGDGTTTARLTPVCVLTGGVVSALAADSWTLFVKADGSLWCCGRHGTGIPGRSGGVWPARVLSGGVASVAAGNEHTLVLKTDGSLWACGSNDRGQLGISTASHYGVETLSLVLSEGVATVAAGARHTLILKTDGSLWACGLNANGQLGDGSTADRRTPVRVLDAGVAAMAAGNRHSLILKTDGTLWACGGNSYGQLGDGTSANHLVPTPIMAGVQAIAARYDQSFALGSASATAVPLLRALWLAQGAPATPTRTVTLTSAALADPLEALASADAGFADASWQPYAAEFPFTLSTGDGEKRVYLKLRNAAGESAPLSATITLDTVAPIRLATEPESGSEEVPLTTGLVLRFSERLLAGPGRIMVQRATDGSLQQEILATGERVTILGSRVEVLLDPLAPNTRYCVVVDPAAFVDVAGNLWAPPAGAPPWEFTTLIDQDGDGLPDAWEQRAVDADPLDALTSLADVRPGADPDADGATNTQEVALGLDPVAVDVGPARTWGSNSHGQLGRPEGTGRVFEEMLAARQVVALAAGGNHALLVGDDGSLWACGRNDSGQLGDGTTTDRSSPVRTLAAGVAAVAAGYGHSVILGTDGSVWTCGDNGYGQLGDGTTTDRTLPVRVLETGAAAVVAGGYHTLIVKADGSLWACGRNDFGQLGDGTTTRRPRLVRTVAGGVSAVAGGMYHTLIVQSDGSLWACGSNERGALGNGTLFGSVATPACIMDSGVVAVAAGWRFSLLVKTDGSLWACGDNMDGQLGNGRFGVEPTPVCSAPSGVAAVAAGTEHSLILRTDGSLWTCGNNAYGQLGDGSRDSRVTPVPIFSGGMTAIAAGGYANLALTQDGSPWACGYNAEGQLGLGRTGVCAPAPLSPDASIVAAVAAGEAHSLYLHSDGSVWAGGSSQYGQLGDGSQDARWSPTAALLDGVRSVAAGAWHSLMVRQDGSLWACGRNHYGQLGGTTLADRATPARVLAGGVAAAAAGEAHSLILKTDGSLWACGNNQYGQLGDGTTTNRLAPVCILEEDVMGVAAGKSHSLIVKADGSLWACGSNALGQLGDGTTTNRLSPVRVLDSGVVAVAAGAGHSLILMVDGSLWACGDNTSGQLGDGTTTSRLTPVPVLAADVRAIAAGGSHSLILTSDASLWACGANAAGQLGDGSTTPRLVPDRVMLGVLAIAAGAAHSLAVTAADSGPLPLIPSFALDAGAAFSRQRQVRLGHVSRHAPTEYQASEDPTFAGAQWLPYERVPTFTLGEADGTKTVYLKLRNAIGESATASATITLDTTPPAIAMEPPSTTPTRTGPVGVLVSWTGAASFLLRPEDVILHRTGTADATVTVQRYLNGYRVPIEPVIDIAAKDVSLFDMDDGVVWITADDPPHRIRFTGYEVCLCRITGDGTLAISIAAGTGQDEAGNTTSAAGPSETILVDNTPPAADLSTPTWDFSLGRTPPLTITFTEPVTGFAASDLVATNGTVTGFSGTDTQYGFSLAPAALGPVTLHLPAAAGTDAAGNPSTASLVWTLNCVPGNEPDSTAEQATPVAAGTAYADTIHRAGDVDWFTLALPPGPVAYALRATVRCPGSAALLSLYGPGHAAALIERTDASATASIGRLSPDLALAPGTYFLEVAAGDAAATPAYTLTPDWTPYYRVIFRADTGGSLTGATDQMVLAGERSAWVRAVPDAGYVFDSWSDGVTNNLRAVARASANLTLTARFRLPQPVFQDGTYRASVSAAEALAGHGLWDLTGHYVTSVAGHPLHLDLVHDTRGRVTGTGSLGVGTSLLPLAARGTVRGTAGALGLDLRLQGRGQLLWSGIPATADIRLSLSLAPAERALQGPAALRLVTGDTPAVSTTPCTLPLTTSMDGSLDLLLRLAFQGRDVSGSALLTLADGTTYSLAFRHGTALDSAVRLALVGDPTDPAAKPLRLTVTVIPIEDGSARLEALDAKAFGQQSSW